MAAKVQVKRQNVCEQVSSKRYILFLLKSSETRRFNRRFCDDFKGIEVNFVLNSRNIKIEFGDNP